MVGDPGIRAAPLVPEQYAYGEAFMVLRAAERFGVGDPLDWWEGLTPGRRAIYLGFDAVRSAEDQRR